MPPTAYFPSLMGSSEFCSSSHLHTLPTIHMQRGGCLTKTECNDLQILYNLCSIEYSPKTKYYLFKLFKQTSLILGNICEGPRKFRISLCLQKKPIKFISVLFYTTPQLFWNWDTSVSKLVTVPLPVQEM